MTKNEAIQKVMRLEREICILAVALLEAHENHCCYCSKTYRDDSCVDGDACCDCTACTLAREVQE